MKRTKRLRILCGQLRPCKSFADVGCDHGYCTLYMLENGLCESAVISDISEKSLHKAEVLLAPYMAARRVRSVCCAGLEQIPEDTEQVLIAGMGGEEILAILREGFLPEKLLLQPMQNAPKVRAFLLENGYAVLGDFTFSDGKYYDVIYAEKGGAVRKYDERCLRFGYDNLHSPSADFLKKVKEDIRKFRARIACAQRAVPVLEERLCELTEVLHEAERNLR